MAWMSLGWVHVCQWRASNNSWICEGWHWAKEEHILEYMASYLAIPEEAVPPPLRRFVSQAGFWHANHPCFAFLMAVWVGFNFCFGSKFWAQLRASGFLFSAFFGSWWSRWPWAIRFTSVKLWISCCKMGIWRRFGSCPPGGESLFEGSATAGSDLLVKKGPRTMKKKGWKDDFLEVLRDLISYETSSTAMVEFHRRSNPSHEDSLS